MNELTEEALINLLTKVSRGPNVAVNKGGNRVTDEVSMVNQNVRDGGTASLEEARREYSQHFGTDWAK